jgi:hypothetical protein
MLNETLKIGQFNTTQINLSLSVIQALLRIAYRSVNFRRNEFV